MGPRLPPRLLPPRRRRALLGARRILASTATATPAVAEDIEARLGLRDPVRVATGFDRPNLVLRGRSLHDDEVKHRRIVDALARPGATPAIVYAGTRAGVERLAAKLSDELGQEVVGYHAGLSRDARATAQRRFMNGDVDVVVATNAFGMGIDKANVRDGRARERAELARGLLPGGRPRRT